MKNKFLDFVENHRKLFIFLVVILVLFVIMFAIRAVNMSNKEPDPSEVVVQTTPTPNPIPTPTPKTEYESYIDSKKNEEEKKHTTEVTKTTEDDAVPEIKPNFEVSCNIFSKTEVPNKNVDGSSCKTYLNSVKLANFDTFWGSSLDINDMQATKKYLVGVDQDDIKEEIADLQSVGWLITNLNKLGKHDVIQFTNLHVIGSLSKSHVAVLCSYDWYSAFGLKDTLVLFEDISGTLSHEDFVDGAIFNATTFVHNIKVQKVNGQNVVCVQYNVFN